MLQTFPRGQLCAASELLPPLLVSMWVPICVPDTPLQIQNPTNGLEKAAKNGPGTWVPGTHVGDLKKAPGF